MYDPYKKFYSNWFKETFVLAIIILFIVGVLWLFGVIELPEPLGRF